MKRIAFLLLSSFTVVAAAQQTQPAVREVGNLVIDGVPQIPARIVERMNQYQNTRSATPVDWDPEGGGLLILTRFAETAQVHHIERPGAFRQQITFFPEPVQSAVYSPDRQKHGFLFSMDTGGGEFYQFYWFDQDTGKSTLLTDGKSRNESALWSDSGKKLAFASTKRNGTDFDLYVMDGLAPKSIRLIKQVQGQWNPVDWSADETSILFSHYVSINESYMYVLNASNGETQEMNPTKGGKKIGYGLMYFARDRKGIYYTSDEDSEFQRLVYYDLASAKKQILTPDLRWDVDGLAVSKDGKWLAYTINENGINKLYLASTSDLMHAQQIDVPQGIIGDLIFDRQSKRLAFYVNSAQTPSDTYSFDIGSRKVERWTYSEVGGLNPKTFVSPELIQYPTFDTEDGKPRTIPAFYYKPGDHSKAPYPVIISIHGGPESQAVASFSSNIQYWINELGAAVLRPNVRGSSGYGKSYLLLDNGYKREDTVKDIGKLLDWIGTRPELDSKRVAVIGGSYGGFMVLSTFFNYNDRLKCAVDQVGISNFVTFLERTEEYRRDLRRAEYGDERDPKMHAFLTATAPVTNAGKIKKPLFVVQGYNDPRVPRTEAEQIVKTVRSNGASVWYLVAKDEGHGFQKKVNKDFEANSISLFFEEHLLKSAE